MADRTLIIHIGVLDRWPALQRLNLFLTHTDHVLRLYLVHGAVLQARGLQAGEALLLALSADACAPALLHFATEFEHLYFYHL